MTTLFEVIYAARKPAAAATLFGAMAAATCALPPCASAQARAGVEVNVTDLDPFLNVAYIPVGADLSSFRFEGAKAVTVATKRISKTDKHYCEEVSREPGGSMYCPYVEDRSPMPAYRISYSYNGPPMASDEYGDRYFTFSVYLHPDELSPAMRRTISAGHSRADVAAFFKLTTSRDAVQRVAIDEPNSTFCDGSYMDGSWTHTNSKCEDRITYKTVTAPSSYITVKIDPVSR